MQTAKFSEAIIIEIDSESVFDYTQDYNKRLEWDTFLKRAELMDGATKADRGVKAYCVAKNGFGMVTEYVSFNRPKTTAIIMTKGPYMFKTFLGSWNFKKLSNQKTEVIFLYSFTLRFPFNLLKYQIKKILQANVRQRLKDLKSGIEEN
jgi:Polyketide cyclase / dehydrase and lipid transport.